ncbi:hypothetical protein SeMB42_g06615 [Synchytrium endobioticum]|uniref:Mediator of RNA polymerase II transcription subunit 11 n=1 Tax=Synchytrium endobioticum TaxID=286115 RepID=A0A507CGV7_9FUNG|nr:hypothetical protein SeMB42_g06615 [Synchytrium endobioticum]TPX39396.1 hypothetical protein SeLEV6574_g07243 [Synchytrium endobioticum]
MDTANTPNMIHTQEEAENATASEAESGDEMDQDENVAQPGVLDHINQINAIEIAIVRLLQVAAGAFTLLPSDAPPKNVIGLSVDELSSRYYKSLNEIQEALRGYIRLLANMGVLARPDQPTMPLRTNTVGEEKDLELLKDAVDVMRRKMRDAGGVLDQYQQEPPLQP